MPAFWRCSWPAWLPEPCAADAAGRVAPDFVEARLLLVVQRVVERDSSAGFTVWIASSVACSRAASLADGRVASSALRRDRPP